MNEKKHRKSRLQRILLEVLSTQSNKIARTKGLGEKVASLYCPEKILKREPCSISSKGKMLQIYRLEDSFSSSFYRLLHELEAQGIVELAYGKPIVAEAYEKRVLVIKKITRSLSSNGKATMVIHHESPFYRNSNVNT